MRLNEVKIYNNGEILTQELESVIEGKVFKDAKKAPCLCYGGKKYPDVKELLKAMSGESQADNLITSESYGTDAYHYDNQLRPLLWTDGISVMVRERQATWLLTLVNSYLPQISTLLQVVSENGHIEDYPIENNNGIDDFIFIHILTDSESNKALFVAECDDVFDEEGERKSRICAMQYIPYTDLGGSLRLYLQKGILLFPSEY